MADYLKTLSLKKVWWFLLTVLGIIYIVRNYSNLNTTSTSLDMLIIYATIVLIFMPLISEISLMGMSVKKQIENTRKEMHDEIYKIRNDIINIKQSNTNNNDISIDLSGVLPSKDKVESDLRKHEEESQTIDTDKSEFNDISEDILYLFKVRFSIETRINEIIEKLNLPSSTIFVELNKLLKKGVLNVDTYGILQRILSICNRGIHSEIIDQEYITYVRTLYPSITSELTELDESIKGPHYCVCPRCKYQGYSEYSNVCPNCGFISDED